MRILLILVGIFTTYIIQAQKKIVGKLVHPCEIPEGVSLILSNYSDKSNLISYAFSNDKGEFEIKYNSSEDSLVLATRSLNYKDTTVVILNKSQNLNIPLQYQVKQLKEVNVNAAPIIAKNDTTVYSVANFATKDNQSIGDVIANMPGFTIDTNGKLSYMGRDIDKYYIEGLDLLGGRYAIANKNLSHNDVRSVEVLHNHQAIKMLRKKVFNEGTSVNIKLKKKNTFSFRAKGAIGAKDLLYSINLSPMVFSPKHQNISSIQCNNIGADLWSQFKPFVYSESELDNSKNNLAELVGITSFAPNITDNKQRVYFNNTKLASVNDLVKISDAKTLKINAAYYCDLANENTQLQTTFYNQYDTTYINEITKNVFKKNNLLTDIVYNVNADKNYLNNQLRIEGNWDEAQNNIYNQQIKQQVSNPSYSIANELDVLKEYKGFFLKFNAFIDYDKLPQNLNIHPGVINDTALLTKQLWEREQLVLKLKSSINLVHDYWIFKSELGGNCLNSELASSIEEDYIPVNIDSLQNKMNWQIANFSINEGISFEKNGLVFRANLPLNLYHYSVDDAVHTADTTFTQLFFAPRFFGRVRFASYWEVNAHATFNNSFGGVEQTTEGYAIKDYRTISKGVGVLPEYKNQFYRAFLEYKNPLAGWLINLQCSKSINWCNVVYNNQSLGDGVYQKTATYYSNTKSSDLINIGSTYFLSKLKSTIGVNASYLSSKWQYILNDELNDSKLKQPEFSINAVFAHLKFMQLKYNFGIKYINQKTPQSLIKLYEQNHKMGLFFYLGTKHWISYSTEYNLNSNYKTKTKAVFGDVTYAYKDSNNKFNYKLQFRNIFNTSVYNQYAYTDISSVKNSYILRPREIVFYISYKF